MNNKEKQKDINKPLKAYLSNLSISDRDRETLVSARKEIRSCLREMLSVNNSPVKFLTQGSFEYQTINRPCHPNQQMDLDDGVYIPDSVAESKEPAEWLDCVAGYLAPLAGNKGWKISTEKPSCVRAVLGKDKHIDIPFYCIADSDIANLSANTPPTVDSISAEIDEFLASMLSFNFRGIDPVNVQMAHRKDGWKRSDPRKIIDWVVSRVKERGRKYIRICRILKGWRDNQWKDDSPLSSIMIMVMVEMAMEEAGISNNSNEQEDKALFDVVDRIVDRVLLGDIPDPDSDNAEPLNSKWNEEQKCDCIFKFNSLQKALYGEGDDADYIKKLREEFGRFFTIDSFINPYKTVTKVAIATTPVAAAARPYASMFM